MLFLLPLFHRPPHLCGHDRPTLTAAATDRLPTAPVPCRNLRRTLTALLALVTVFQAAVVQAQDPRDWPMWGCDPMRSGASPTALELPEELHLQWVRQLEPPRRAWRAQFDDKDKLEFDLSYSPIVYGERVFVGSMTTDRVTAYALDSGDELWRAYTDAPVRLAPAAWDERLYVVADDGFLRCLDVETGDLLWRFNAAPAPNRVLGNERVIGMWPVRGGPVVKDGIVYFAAGIWPFLGTFVYALDAETGAVVWANTGEGTTWQRQPHGGAYAFAGLAPQGYLAVSDDRVVVSGGRALPGLFDRRDGRMLFSIVDGKEVGGYRVRLDAESYYNHGRRFSLADGHDLGAGALQHPAIDALNLRVEGVRDQLDSEVFESLAARERLLVTTRNGTLYCFGGAPTEPRRFEPAPVAPARLEQGAGARAEEILAQTPVREGYALFLGIGDGDLLEQVALRSAFHIVGIEPDPARIERLRLRFDAAGLYGTRISLLPGNPADAPYPPYISSLVIVEDPAILGRAPDPAEFLSLVYSRLRPYDGCAVFLVDEAVSGRDGFSEFEPPNGRIAVQGDRVLLFRDGPLPGSGQWTHQYADSAQTVMSHDDHVRPPFAPIWFGGPTNQNVIPRHTTGPRPHVVQGRTILMGVETVSARCAFTGRELWVREFPGVGHAFTDLALEERWRSGESVYMTVMPGATYIGSPYVSLPDAIYLRYQGRILRLDPTDGSTQAEWPVPVSPREINPPEPETASDQPGADDALGQEEEAGEGGEADQASLPDWGHVSVCGDLLITTADPHIFDDGRLGQYPLNWDGTSSERLIVMDRHTGEILWTRQAANGFRHNAIVSSGNRLFVVDSLTEAARDRAQRRGLELSERPRVLALDLRDGTVLWENDSEVFGTFLSYSQEYDVLVEGGSRDGRRHLEDEPMSRVIARRGSDGTVLWDRPGEHGPRILHGAEVIPGRPGPALNLLTGEHTQRVHPLTEETVQWDYWRAYGCSTANASTHALFFRSGSAGYMDLEHDGGTGSLGGFKSGCTANLIAAEGILNAPDFTRTCTCSYQNQTSMALIHAPEIDVWSVYNVNLGAGPLVRGGVNLGAPGARRDADETMWVHYPPSEPDPPGPQLDLRVASVDPPLSATHVHSVSASRTQSGVPRLVVDGDPRSHWAVRGDAEGKFDAELRLDLNQVSTVSAVELAWTAPAATGFRVQTSVDGETWTQVLAGEWGATEAEFQVHEFEPVEARCLRVLFDAHPELQRDHDGRPVLEWVQVRELRVRPLHYPNANAFFMPKDVFRKHPLFMRSGDGPGWVAASGVRGIALFRLDGMHPGSDGLYTVTLHFSEPDTLGPGERVFDVFLQGDRVLTDFDVAAEAGSPDRSVTRVFEGVPVADSLRIELRPVKGRAPILSGVEFVGDRDDR